MNPNTVAQSLPRSSSEHEEGIIELRHGSGAFISEAQAWKTAVTRKAQTVVQSAVEKLNAFGLTETTFADWWKTSWPAAGPKRSCREPIAWNESCHRNQRTAEIVSATGATALERSRSAACHRGSIFGFPRPQRSRKTTTIKSLMGIIKPDSGTPPASSEWTPWTLRTTGRPVPALASVTEDKDLYPYMTVGQIIRFTRPFFPKWRGRSGTWRYLKIFDLSPKRKITDLSKGTRSKLMLLLAVCHSAELLILDEPTDGLDPAVTEEVLRELVTIAGSGTTIFFSSHHLGEVEQIADNICIVDRGKAIVADRPRRSEGPLSKVSRRAERRGTAGCGAYQAAGIEYVRQEGRTVSILASGNLDEIAEQIGQLPGATMERFPVPA